MVVASLFVQGTPTERVSIVHPVAFIAIFTCLNDFQWPFHVQEEGQFRQEMPKPYRIVAANLDSKSIAEADRIASVLREEGWPRATRSLVIREALERLQEDLSGKTPAEVFGYFIDRRGKRVSRVR